MVVVFLEIQNVAENVYNIIIKRMKKTIFVVMSLFLINMFLSLSVKTYYYHYFIFMCVLPFLGLFLKNTKQLVYTILSYTILMLVINVVLENQSFFYSFFSHLFVYVVLFTTGFLLRNHKKFLFIPILALVLFMKFGFNDYQSYIREVDNDYGNLEPLPKIVFLDKNKNPIYLDSIKNKVIVLDFWGSRCSICFKKFPYFEKAIQQYKSNPNILFYAVNIPYKNENIEQTIAFTKKNIHYDFEHLFALNHNVYDSLHIKSVPTLLIIKNDTIYYKGNLVIDDKTKKHYLLTEIENALHL